MDFLWLLWDYFSVVVLVAAIIFTVTYHKSRTFRFYVKFGFFVTHSALMASIFIPIMIFRPRSWKNALLPAAGLRIVKTIFGLKWTVRGIENIVDESGAIVLINHQSILDLLVLAEMWPIMDNCTVISKKEIFYLGPFGLASWLWGTIFIDRLNTEKAVQKINETGRTVRSDMIKLLMFPEGTRHGKDYLLPFKKGAFHVAIASSIPIQPVVVSKYYYIDWEAKKFEPGRTVIEILPAVPTDSYDRENMHELMNIVYEEMSAKYRELNEELCPSQRKVKRLARNNKKNS